jgi:6-phosphogluconolactonase
VIADTSSLHVHPDQVSVIDALAQHVVAQARVAVAERGRFTWALAGGSTPRRLYELLASEQYRTSIDWSKVYVFFGDERCVPPDSEESNYRMAREALLSQVPVPEDNVLRMAGELEPEVAAEAYTRALGDVFTTARFPDAAPEFDLILLGMGDDGHTASLFPGSPALGETVRWVSAAKKGEQSRLTLTYPVLNAAREVVFLVMGANKQTMLANVLGFKGENPPWPAVSVRPTRGALRWFLDEAAAVLIQEHLPAKS